MVTNKTEKASNKGGRPRLKIDMALFKRLSTVMISQKSMAYILAFSGRN